MKVLWITNTLLPAVAEKISAITSASGSWLIDIADKLRHSNNIEFAVASVYGDEYKCLEIEGVKYYLLPGNGKNMLFYTKKYEQIWKQINEDFKPDIVHLHGTEYSHGLSFLRACPNVKAVVSIQGLINRIKDVDFGGLSVGELVKNRTVNEYLHFNGMIENHFLHKKNAKYETEILHRVQYANCVNCWDSSLVKSINPDIKCFMLEYNLRDDFYTAPKWNIDNIQRHKIFSNPGGVPLKGIHILLSAVEIVKKTYPDVMLVVPGMGDESGKIKVKNGYTKYLDSIVKSKGLTENVQFLGRQTGEEMMKQMLSSNAVVVPSAIEGTSLVLREAMFLGVPCVASFRGGMADFISDKNDGFLYDYQEYPYLASRIMELFESENLCNKFSKNAIIKAETAHNREMNPQAYLSMYDEIFNS